MKQTWNHDAHWEHSVDVVVMGGGTGLFAAMVAARAGLEVLLVEKTDVVGGSTTLSGGGLWLPGNRALRDAGVQDTPERAATYLRGIVGDSAPEDRWQIHLRHSARVVDLLEKHTPLRFSHMDGYSDYYSDEPGGCAAGRSVEPMPFDLRSLGDKRSLLRETALKAPVPMPITGADYRWMNLMAKRPGTAVPRIARRVAQGVGGQVLGKEMAAGGSALGAGLLHGALAAGVDIWTDSPVSDLLTDGDRVVGVFVDENGEGKRVQARKGVIVASGGFDHHTALRKRHQSPLLGKGWSLGSPGNTGDAQSLAEHHDLALTLMDKAWWFPAVAPVAEGQAPKVMLAERSLPGSLIVDARGRRFVNESTDYMRFGQTMLGLPVGSAPDGGAGAGASGGASEDASGGAAHEPAGETWMVFDQRYRNSYVLATELMPRMPIPKAWYEAGIAHSAGSIAELAQKLAAPELVEQVERFNLLASQGHDDDFGRGLTAYDRYYGDPTNTPNPNLRPLTDGPFHAVKVVAGDLGTCGGLQADEHARVLRTDGSVMGGLYAIGNAAGNVFGGVYPGAGATIGQGLTLGLAAVEHLQHPTA